MFSALSFLRFSSRLWCARILAVALTGVSAVRAGLPTVEGPKSSTDSSYYGQIVGYFNDAVVLTGLVLAAAAMLSVGNAMIATFSEVRDGKSTWGKFGMLVIVGVILIVVVIWLASKAATILL
ncbi:TIGR03745 family integrating conjugative element membrane protein [Salmonella enterica]|uniref:TIGR03745 family integrating conjugative element membrane protein n=2 Tax=Salmonella infantis TaxID=595 RepID=A0A5Y7ADP4_SALIN|nr:TIGR03745 family integrating conjugative element membrane protein [Salmonella enterica]EAB9926716.1 TIGR03745 family integrating conjugative element membrane protein [Salmonella enterica subsp. enterica serovar Kua]EBR8476704.1 TIGR03745 family integrating conjugative element membrane protein [Salmonella enterica subsp. enterica serovar Nima]EBV7250906.1 TIGR03745 family integrating conjugative element membrane protein [Salmonella enterica subsp. enterica serovar Pomona]ECA6119159.1 TIGR0374